MAQYFPFVACRIITYVNLQRKRRSRSFVTYCFFERRVKNALTHSSNKISVLVYHSPCCRLQRPPKRRHRKSSKSSLSTVLYEKPTQNAGLNNRISLIGIGRLTNSQSGLQLILPNLKYSNMHDKLLGLLLFFSRMEELLQGSLLFLSV